MPVMKVIILGDHAPAFIQTIYPDTAPSPQGIWQKDQKIQIDHQSFLTSLWVSHHAADHWRIPERDKTDVHLLLINSSDDTSKSRLVAWLNQIRDRHPPVPFVILDKPSDENARWDAAYIKRTLKNTPLLVDYLELKTNVKEDLNQALVKGVLLLLTNTPLGTEKLDDRGLLIEQLTQCIQKIKPIESNRFLHRFLPFKKNKAINQEADYRVAQYLLHELTTTNHPIADIFNMDAINKQRAITLVSILKNTPTEKTAYQNHGVTHHELNRLIETAQFMVQQETLHR